MIIYEVNLNIDEDIFPQYERWLKAHVQAIIQFPGFIQAMILTPETKTPLAQKQLTVHYLLEDREALERYFKELAPKMREDGLTRFKDKFSAERRILVINDVSISG